MIRALVIAVDAAGVYVQTAEFGVVGPLEWLGLSPEIGDRVLVANTGDDTTPDLIVIGVLP